MFKLIRPIYFFCFMVGLIGIPFLSGNGRAFSNVDYFRTLNRTASLGTIDSIFFNPSGTTRLNDGIFLSFGVPIDNNFGTAVHFGQILPSVAFVHKESGKSIFFSVAPLPSTKVIVADSRTSSSDLVADYNINHMTYEFSLGGGFSLRDSLMFSVAGKLHGSIDSDKIQYYKGIDGKKVPGENGLSNVLRESYFLSRYEAGFRLHLGFSYQPMSWFSLSLNMDALGMGTSRYLMAQFVPSKTNVSKQSEIEGRPQKKGVSENIWVSLPAYFDIGLRFNANDMMILQVTGYLGTFGYKNRLPESKEKISFKPTDMVKNISYGAGVGMDFQVARNVIFGLGTHFDHQVRSREIFYKSLVDTIAQRRLTSLSFSTGVQIEIVSLFDFSFSFVYPLYLSFQKGFQINSFKEPHTGGKVNVKGVEFALGFNLKFYGL